MKLETFKIFLNFAQKLQKLRFFIRKNQLYFLQFFVKRDYSIPSSLRVPYVNIILLDILRENM
jgi:hypothetical protein